MARKPKPDDVKPSRTRTVSTSESGGDGSAARPPKTIAEGRKLIEQAYRVAQEFFFQTINVECHRSSLNTVRGFAYFEIDPPEDIDRVIERWKRYSEKAFSELETAFNRLAELKPILDDAFAPVMPLLDYAAAELEPIKTTRGTYRHAYGYLTVMSYHQTDFLFHQVRSIFSLKRVPAFSSELNMAYENIERAATPEDMRQLVASRLIIERSQLARDLPNYLAYAGESSGLTSETAHNATSQQDEREQELSKLKPCYQKAYLAFFKTEKLLGKELTCKQAWSYLREHGTDFEYELPSEENFSTYVVKARSALGELKNQPRGGRADGSRSIVRPGEI